MLFQPPAAAPYPVRLEADHPDRLSRLSTLFRLILAIPLLLMVGIVGGSSTFVGPGFGIAFGLISLLLVVHWITIILRRRPVGWLFNAIVAVQRFVLRADTYPFLMTDRYPPFEGDWPIRFEVDRPEKLSRWQVLIWKTILSIPHFFVLTVLGFVVGVFVFFAWFIILFTGRFPKGLYNFIVGWLRWYARVVAYWMSLTDVFPPFSLSEDAGPGGRTSYVLSAVAGGFVFLGAIGGLAAVAAIPGETQEVRVRYEDLLDGAPSRTGVISDTALTITSAQDPYRFQDDLLAPAAGERFVLFRLDVENRSVLALTVSQSDFRLRDSLGGRHDPVLLTVAGLTTPARVFEGRRAPVAVLFEVPDGSDPVELTYSPLFGFKSRLKFVFE